MINKETIFCPAKINLFLEVGASRPDGYHNIDSIMQSVDLCDLLTLTVSDGDGRVTLACSDPSLTDEDSNIATKAVRAYMMLADISGVDVHIEIEKNIPVAAGLAGGSADAAGALILMERHFGALGKEELYRLGGRLGADVPFCMMRGAARARGIGELLEPTASLSRELSVVVAVGGEGVSTREAYAGVSEGHRTADEMKCMLERGDVFGVCGGVYNAFEQTVCPMRPAVNTAKSLMLDGGALCSQMSGSGPSVFGIFSDIDLAERTAEQLRSIGYRAFVTFSVV